MNEAGAGRVAAAGLADQPSTSVGADPASGSAAAAVEPLVTSLLGDRLPVRIDFWDGSAIGPKPPDLAVGALRITSPDALRRIVWSPGELGVGRSYVAGDIDFEGDVVAMVEALRDVAPPDLRFGIDGVRRAFGAARRVGALGLPPPPPPEETRPSGWRHSKGRDAQAISHHYDVSNEFYRLVLGPSMTYSCARFETPETSLADAQTAKHELICRKLGLHERPGGRLLDVGCGWGSLALHAAQAHQASVVGITISTQQAELARLRVKEAGLSERVEIRLQDYRDLRDETFDAISSVGMFEHVGAARIGQYFETLRPLLAPRGRLLNHAISSIGGSSIGRRSFMGRYVFPDGELIDVGEVVLAMERCGFEVRDVEALREHYAATLRCWIDNLETDWDQAVRLVGVARARIWRLYMAASAVGFHDGGVAIHQVLGVVPDAHGGSGLPPTRQGW